MEIVLDSAVRFKAPYEDAQFITSCIEKSEILNNASGLSEVLVNWQLPEMERLAGIVPREIKVPSPITRDYDWPGLFKPFDHQVEIRVCFFKIKMQVTQNSLIIEEFFDFQRSLSSF